MLLLACLTVTVGCLYRITYFLLFIPVILCYARMKPGLRMAVAALLAAAVSVGCYLLTSAVTAPYTQGFLYHLLRASDAGTFVQMLLSHTKSNLIDYFGNTVGTPWSTPFTGSTWARRGCAWRARSRRWSAGKAACVSDGALSRGCLGGFLMLMAAFGIIVVLYETNDWSDLRTLAPFLWLVAGVPDYGGPP